MSLLKIELTDSDFPSWEKLVPMMWNEGRNKCMQRRRAAAAFQHPFCRVIS